MKILLIVCKNYEKAVAEILQQEEQVFFQVLHIVLIVAQNFTFVLPKV